MLSEGQGLRLKNRPMNRLIVGIEGCPGQTHVGARPLVCPLHSLGPAVRLQLGITRIIIHAVVKQRSLVRGATAMAGTRTTPGLGLRSGLRSELGSGSDPGQGFVQGQG